MDLPVRLCAGGCGSKVPKGRRCASCSKARGRRRATAASRGYGPAWARFRLAFMDRLAGQGILPTCGARLPGGPSGDDSRCAASGHLTFQSQDGSQLHLDHDPPLLDAERDDPDRVCDPYRVQLLCAECHARKDDPGRQRHASLDRRAS